MPIQFFFPSINITLGNRRKLKEFIDNIFRSEGKNLFSLAIIFCTDEYLLTINKQFLQHDYYTDIITFNLAKPSAYIEGEIYISIERIKENALVNKVSVTNELHRIIFHGVLHLCGFKDKKRSEKATMTTMENKYLDRYFSLF